VRLINKLSLSLGILSLAGAAGCGGGGSVTLPNSTGNYSNASLNGSYVYQIHGTSALGAYREIGVFTTDKAGNITGGSDDFAAGGVISNTITGSYSVSNDGTGFLTINPTALGPITFAITLASPSKVYLMEADTFADGAGVAELQASPSVTPSGTFVFRLHQVSATLGQNPASDVGAFTITGGAVTGNMDQNLGGTSSQLTLTSGTFNAPSAAGRGTGSFTDNTNLTTSFVYYVVDTTKMALLVSNASTVASGSAEAQTGAIGSGLSGSYAFGSRGDFGSLNDAAATAGQFTASGGTISAYVNDSMQLGNYANASFTGSYTSQANGRVAVNLNSNAIQEVFWMVSPSRAFFLVNDPSRVEDGTADLQTVSTFAPSTMKGQYAMVMDGIDLSPEILARIGTAQFNGASTLTVNELANASSSGAGAQSPGALSGTYAITANGRAVGTLSGVNGGLTVVTYAVSGSDAYALQVDGLTNTSGAIELQH
jgi:hypothetical protein